MPTAVDEFIHRVGQIARQNGTGSIGIRVALADRGHVAHSPPRQIHRSGEMVVPVVLQRVGDMEIDTLSVGFDKSVAVGAAQVVKSRDNVALVPRRVRIFRRIGIRVGEHYNYRIDAPNRSYNGRARRGSLMPPR